MARIIQLHDDNQWAYECPCGNMTQWDILVTPPNNPDGLGFTGFRCLSCGKIIEFNGKEEIIFELEE